MTTIKITELSSIGANLATSTVLPVVNMSGTPTTEKTTLGNIANVVLAGAGGNYTAAAVAILAQKVTNAAQPNITSVGTLTSLSVTGNVTGGNLITTGNANVGTLSVTGTSNLGAVGNVTITGGTVGQVLTTNGSNVLSWTSAAGTYGNSNVAAYLPTYTGNIGGNVVTANLFSGNGTNLTNIAGANVSGFVPNANVANTAFAVAGANVSGFVPNANVANTAFAVAGANVSGFVPNANVANTAFAVAAANVSGLGNIATINLTGSNSNVLYGNGVFAAVAGGGANTGNVTFNNQIVLGTGSNDGSGGLYLAPGTDSIANSAVQYLRVRGGDVVTHIHLDTGNNAYYDQYFGADDKFVKLEANGNVLINASNLANNSSATWTFDTTGNLTLPNDANIAIYGNTTQFNSCPNGFLGLNTYDAGGNNIARVSISSTDNSVSIGISDPITEIDYNWFFSNGGNLTLPGNLVIAGNANVFGTNSSLLQTIANRPLIALSSGANGAVSSLWVEDIGNVGTSNIAAVYANPTVGSGIVRIAVGQNGGNTGPNLWDFGATGNLTLPTNGHIIVSGGLVSSGASPAPTINGFSITNSVGISGNGNIAGGNVLTAGIVKTGVFVTGNIPAAATAGAGARAFVTDATLATFGSAYVGGAANAVPVWSDGSAWYIG